MGSSTCAEIVKNVARIETLPRSLYDPEECEFFPAAGYTVGDDCFEYGRLYTTKLTDGKGEAVLLVNTDQYESGGGQDWVVFGDDRKHVENFLKAFGLKAKIKAQDAIAQTL